MSVADYLELGQKVFSLVSTTERLDVQFGRLEERIRDHGERIVKLESREEVITLKCQNAAIISVSAMNNQLVERIVNIENTITTDGPKLLENK
ncbi:MAG: hypothetical protein HQ568_05130 [Calditrichaeota bacterium]|nr:hypothetical protein [Calditrichota bacterium]